MNHKERILRLFQDSGIQNGSSPAPFMPDLTIWYDWHSKKGSLPGDFSGMTLEDLCRSLGFPIWNHCKPWRVESDSVEVVRNESKSEKTIQYRLGNTVLSSRWIVGPDGDWWQSEYPVKTVDDLDVIRTYLDGRRFHLETDKLRDMLERTAYDGIVVPELPSRAFSWLMLEILGWNEGLMLLMDAQETIGELASLAERQIQSFTGVLVKEARRLGCRIALSPDNLDGMFVSPGYFDRYLADGYSNTAEICHKENVSLMVHAGGPVGSLLGRLAQCGIDCVAGVSGSPQGDTTIEAAREKAGDEMVFWGGLPQDYLLDNSSAEEFDEKVGEIIQVAIKDGRCILGIADHVPLEADIERLKRVAVLCKSRGQD